MVPRLREGPPYQMCDLSAGITEETLIGWKGTASKVESPELWNLSHSEPLMAQDGQKAYLGQAWEWRSETPALERGGILVRKLDEALFFLLSALTFLWMSLTLTS